MSHKDWREYVGLMIADIDRIDAFMAGMDRAGFAGDQKSVFAVSYAFVRIGEAVVNLPAELIEDHPEIEWRDVRRFRNFLVHVYVAVDPARLYDTAKQYLPELRQKLGDLLADA